MKNVKKLPIIPILLLFSCAAPPSVSFNGINIAPDVATLSVSNFYMEAAQGPANLAPDFTEKLRDYYARNTRLSVISDNGDLMLEGAVVGYQVAPVAPVAGQGEFEQIAAKQRLTMTVKVQYINQKDPEKDFERDFSHFADFDNDKNLPDVEAELLEPIYEQIILTIFNATVADW